MRPTTIGRLSLLTMALSTTALADSTLDWPVGEIAPYPMDSGVQANGAAEAGVLFRGTVRMEGVAWLRLYFGEVILGEGSSIRMTSLEDGAVQELDAQQLQMWRDTSAYFNGDAVMIELIAGAGTAHNRFALEMVALEMNQGGTDGSCGICGPDDRVPSGEDWAGRILPVGCTGSIWNEESCVVSAGHCVGADDVLQFRVPASNGDCSLNHPGPEDQFPITSRLFENSGVGGDWAVMTTGTNNLNETPYERYGLLRRIATIPANENDACVNWGYGIDQECVRNQIQQTHDGTIVDVNPSNYQFDVDITFGNSGSSLLKGDEIIGIVTHCTENCPNFATRMDLPQFIAARNTLCPPMSPHTFGPNNFAVQFGVLESGGLDDLQASDDQKLVIRQRASLSPLLPVARLFMDGYAAFVSSTQMDFVIEASANALPANVPQRAELWNFDVNAFQVVDERTASSTDSTALIEITTSPERFVDVDTNHVVARVDWFDPGVTFFVAWNVSVDRIAWTVRP